MLKKNGKYEIEITDLISNYHDATGTVMITQDGLTDLEV